MTIEHANITVRDPKTVAAQLCDLFGWTVRWEGKALNNGYTVHVGDTGSYLALYAPAGDLENSTLESYQQNLGLNHIGVVVSDLGKVEEKVKAAGYLPHTHSDYEPGRFYFDGPAGIEFEAVQYD
ncbi:MAG: VOC family protein [Pseudoruegeria sp.]